METKLQFQCSFQILPFVVQECERLLDGSHRQQIYSFNEGVIQFRALAFIFYSIWSLASAFSSLADSFFRIHYRLIVATSSSTSLSNTLHLERAQQSQLALKNFRLMSKIPVTFEIQNVLCKKRFHELLPCHKFNSVNQEMSIFSTWSKSICPCRSNGHEFKFECITTKIQYLVTLQLVVVLQPTLMNSK